MSFPDVVAVGLRRAFVVAEVALADVGVGPDAVPGVPAVRTSLEAGMGLSETEGMAGVRRHVVRGLDRVSIDPEVGDDPAPGEQETHVLGAMLGTLVMTGFRNEVAGEGCGREGGKNESRDEREKQSMHGGRLAGGDGTVIGSSPGL